ncbi:MAG: hypothetical protein IJY20_01000 [Clostridia bacterium]|nr:hypothetical protein [Clostridia bacterium]
MVNDQCLAKGFYRYAQNSEFVSVKQYMFVRARGKKCLLLRFSNDMGYDVTLLRFTLVQLNADGDVIQRTPLCYNSLHVNAGTAFATQRAIVVDEACTDFKIIFHEVGSGCYRYVVKDGNVMVYYQAETADHLIPQVATHTATPEKKKPRNSIKRCIWVAILMLFALILMDVLHLVSLYNEGLAREEERENMSNDFDYEQGDHTILDRYPVGDDVFTDMRDTRS